MRQRILSLSLFLLGTARSLAVAAVTHAMSVRACVTRAVGEREKETRPTRTHTHTQQPFFAAAAGSVDKGNAQQLLHAATVAHWYAPLVVRLLQGMRAERARAYVLLVGKKQFGCCCFLRSPFCCPTYLHHSCILTATAYRPRQQQCCQPLLCRHMERS